MKIKTQKHFWRRYVLNWTEDVFVIKKVKNTVPWIHSISDLNGLEQKRIKRKSDKLYFKQLRYNNSFNCSFDKKDIVI